MTLTPLVWSHFAVLFAAHAAGDFLLQTSRDVTHRRRPAVLLKHVLIHAGLAYVLVGDWRAWPLPVAVFVTHALIDAIKSRCPDTARVFLADQLAHLVVLVGIALWLAHPDARVPGAPWLTAGGGRGWLDLLGPGYPRGMALLGGFVATVEAGAYLIAKVVRPYLDELEHALDSGERSPARPPRGLTNAGRDIGRLERTLIFLFVLVNLPAGIGFLMAAKSIFRFGELKETANRMESEYIIIGTLASFGYAIALSYGVSALVRLIVPD